MNPAFCSALNVNGTRIALYAGYGTAKEDPMQMQVEKTVFTANESDFKLRRNSAALACQRSNGEAADG